MWINVKVGVSVKVGVIEGTGVRVEVGSGCNGVWVSVSVSEGRRVRVTVGVAVSPGEKPWNNPVPAVSHETAPNKISSKASDFTKVD